MQTDTIGQERTQMGHAGITGPHANRFCDAAPSAAWSTRSVFIWCRVEGVIEGLLNSGAGVAYKVELASLTISSVADRLFIAVLCRLQGANSCAAVPRPDLVDIWPE